MSKAWSINLFEYKLINTHLKFINLKLTFLEEKMKSMSDNTYKKKYCEKEITQNYTFKNYRFKTYIFKGEYENRES